MIFQTLDTKSECVGIYKEGELYFEDVPSDLTHTWDYSEALKGLDIQYAHLYCEGKTLEEICPPELKADFDRVSKKLRAFLNSFIESKVDLKENCFYDLTPQRFLKEYCEIKNRITEHVFKNYNKPREYEFIKDFTEFANSIARRQLRIDKSWLAEKLYDVQGKRLWDKVNDGATSIKYNMFGSVTGRLTVSENSFPILNLNKNLRSAVVPTNDWFVEFDLNAAELRVAQALMSHKQVIGDFHEWSAENIFKGELTRTEAKETATRWLYNSSNKLGLKYGVDLENFYKKKALEAMYWDGSAVSTPFGRVIPCDQYHVMSYLNQSTLIDLFHRQILKMNKKLDDKKSFIPFMVHDSVVLDLKDEDKKMLPELIKELSDTKWGTFPVNVKIGSNYGNMKKVTIKV